MKTSLAGAMEIIGHEGIVLSRYKDSVGVWSLGCGHTAAAGPPDPRTFTGKLTVKQALDLFRRDLEKYERDVNAAFKVPLRQHEFDAATSFHYNSGAIRRASWVRLFNQGKRREAIAAIMNWKKPPEIAGRRKKEQQLFATGFYTGAGFGMVYPADARGRVLWAQGKRVDLAKEYGGIPSEPIQPPSRPVEAPKPKPAPPQPPRPKPAPAPAPAPQRGFWAAVGAFLRTIASGGQR